MTKEATQPELDTLREAARILSSYDILGGHLSALINLQADWLSAYGMTPRDLNGQDIYHEYLCPGPQLYAVVIVAAVNARREHGPNDWAAYIGGVLKEWPEDQAIELVKDWGAKIPEQWARAVFPHLAESPYRRNV